jgi:cell wall-associated NlpC family hydrolase
MTKQEMVNKYLGRVFGQGASRCFLFVKHVYETDFGMEIKNDYLEMLSKFHPVKVENLRFGDIVLVRNHPIVINHIGIYVGDDEFMHAGMDATGVIVTALNDQRYKDRIAGFVRHPGMINDHS